jgi:hypothetical protein
MTTTLASKNGLEALLTPQDSVLFLIDHQPFQFANLHSHEPMMIVNNVIGLAKAAKVFNVPTILTTVVEDRGGKLIKGLQEVFPDQKPIDRTWIKNLGRRAGRRRGAEDRPQEGGHSALWTEICLAMPAIQAAGEGYEVYAVTDASGGVSVEAHEMGVAPHDDGWRGADELAGGLKRMATRLGSSGFRGGACRNGPAPHGRHGNFVRLGAAASWSEDRRWRLNSPRIAHARFS